MEDKITKLLCALALLVMGVAIGFVGCYDAVYRLVETSIVARPATTSEQTSGAQKYNEIKSIIDQYFIGDDVDETAMNDAVGAAMIQSLGDRWSYYISAEEYQNYLDNMNNSYIGVGITISAHADAEGNLVGYEVLDVTTGGSAEEAGVKVGDILIEVDGASVMTMSLNETKNKVRGVEGTTVVMTFLRGEDTVVLDVTRKAFTVTPASGRLLEDTVGYIQISNFDAGASEAVIALIEELRAQGAESLLFDVRNNPGGMRVELTALLDYLLPEGTIFHSVDYTGAEEIITSDPEWVDMPMAVLVNADSYSAAEYFACALQDYQLATVVGEHTFGKGYFQVGITLSDGSCVNLSVGKYYTPNGISLIDVGVTPDIEVALDDELSATLSKDIPDVNADPQLQAALGCLLD